ncbi:GNAT family N-acetyltransferase [Leifsonia sp. P73]|uniref:GNAT family N-acetyltransferase n=1 Tax=Leifsonia sp. P73 TaxID=3423959 RepID=UPI003DA69302
MDFEAEQAAYQARNAELIAEISTARVEDLCSAWDLEIVNDPQHARWEAILNEDSIGELSYRLVGDRIVLLSTWVSYPYRQRRVATELIARALDQIRAVGKTVTVICPVIGEFIAHNEKYRGLVDPLHPGSGMSALHASASDEEQLIAFEQEVG